VVTSRVACGTRAMEVATLPARATVVVIMVGAMAVRKATVATTTVAAMDRHLVATDRLVHMADSSMAVCINMMSISHNAEIIPVL